METTQSSLPSLNSHAPLTVPDENINATVKLTHHGEIFPCGGGCDIYKGFSTDLNRLLMSQSEILKSEKVKDKLGKLRLIVTCTVCNEYEYEAQKIAANGNVYFAHGVRIEGKAGAQ